MTIKFYTSFEFSPKIFSPAQFKIECIVSIFSQYLSISKYRAQLFNLTTWLVNISLIFQMFISPICQYFLSKNFEKLLQCRAKASLIFQQKKLVYSAIKS